MSCLRSSVRPRCCRVSLRGSGCPGLRFAGVMFPKVVNGGAVGPAGVAAKAERGRSYTRHVTVFECVNRFDQGVAFFFSFVQFT